MPWIIHFLLLFHIFVVTIFIFLLIHVLTTVLFLSFFLNLKIIVRAWIVLWTSIFQLITLRLLVNILGGVGIPSLQYCLFLFKVTLCCGHPGFTFFSNFGLTILSISHKDHLCALELVYFGLPLNLLTISSHLLLLIALDIIAIGLFKCPNWSPLVHTASITTILIVVFN